MVGPGSRAVATHGRTHANALCFGGAALSGRHHRGRQRRPHRRGCRRAVGHAGTGTQHRLHAALLQRRAGHCHRARRPRRSDHAETAAVLAVSVCRGRAGAGPAGCRGADLGAGAPPQRRAVRGARQPGHWQRLLVVGRHHDHGGLWRQGAGHAGGSPCCAGLDVCQRHYRIRLHGGHRVLVYRRPVIQPRAGPG